MAMDMPMEIATPLFLAPRSDGNAHAARIGLDRRGVSGRQLDRSGACGSYGAAVPDRRLYRIPDGVAGAGAGT